MGNNNKCLRLILVSVFIGVVCYFPGAVDGYKNLTVGDSLGWYDAPSVDYQKWAANYTFSLGDFLVFNTDNNHSVVQTYNLTTYKLCGNSDALDNDTIEWSSADPSSTATRPITVSVPLVKAGMTYFFSSDYDGEQCQIGQHFKINVTYGQGLPPSLKSPSGDSPGPTSPQSGDDESAPDTLVPSNFDHPRDMSDDDDGSDSEASKSDSLLEFTKLIGVQLHGLLLVVVGFICF